MRIEDTFSIRGQGAGPYRMLAILRWVMVLIFVSFGIQKFTPELADLSFNTSATVHLSDGFPYLAKEVKQILLGIIELATAGLLAAGAFNPIISALGSLMATGTFLITWSFFFTTPGVVKWSFSTDPIAWNLTGEFLYKDIVLLCVCVVLFLGSLTQSSLLPCLACRPERQQMSSLKPPVASRPSLSNHDCLWS